MGFNMLWKFGLQRSTFTVIQLFNSNSLFQLLTCSRCFQHPTVTTISTFNRQFRFSMLNCTCNSQPWFDFSTLIQATAIATFNHSSTFQRLTAIATFNRDLVFQRSTAIPIFNHDSTFQHLTAISTSTVICIFSVYDSNCSSSFKIIKIIY